MKAAGIVRTMDDLQRIVIPKSVLLATGAGHWEGRPYEISVEGTDILLKPESSATGNSGVVRRMDDLQRLAIPVEILRAIGVEGGGKPYEFFRDAETIILRQYIVEGMDEFSKKRMDKVLVAMKELNSEKTSHEEIDLIIQDAMDEIESAVRSYYNDTFDPDEPGIATINLIGLLEDLKDVAKLNKNVE